MSEFGKPDGIHPAEQIKVTPPTPPTPPQPIDFEKLRLEESEGGNDRAREELKEMVRRETPKIKTAIKNYLSARMAETMTQSGGVSAQEARFRCTQLQLMARHVLKAINTAAPPKQDGGAVGECWRAAAGADGAKLAELFGKQLVKAREFAPAVEEALKTVVEGGGSAGSKEHDTEEARAFFLGFVSTAEGDDAEELGDVCWSEDWQAALQARTKKREAAAKARVEAEAQGTAVEDMRSEVKAWVEEIKELKESESQETAATAS